MSGTFQVQIFAQPADAALNWRLLSGNNRSAGMGVTSFASETACRTALRELQRGTTYLRHRLRPTPDNRWAWELLDGDVVVAVAGHAFDRVGRCEHALGKFLVHFATAPVAVTVLDSGSRRWVGSGRRTRGDDVSAGRNSSRVHAGTVSASLDAELVLSAWRPTVRPRLAAPTPDRKTR